MGKVHEYYVYILSNVDGSYLYVGVTSEMGTRLIQHGTGAFKGYTSATDACILRYYEKHNYIRNAIAREKQIKGMRQGEEDRSYREHESGVEGFEFDFR